MRAAVSVAACPRRDAGLHVVCERASVSVFTSAASVLTAFAGGPRQEHQGWAVRKDSSVCCAACGARVSERL
jgi:hypothetical protein